MNTERLVMACGRSVSEVNRFLDRIESMLEYAGAQILQLQYQDNGRFLLEIVVSKEFGAAMAEGEGDVLRVVFDWEAAEKILLGVAGVARDSGSDAVAVKIYGATR